MNQHLSPHEFVDSLDGTLAAERLDHLASCPTCREEIEQLRLLMSDVEASTPAPQPSPLFWDHFSDRVRQATSGAEPAARPAWWAQAWRPLAAFAGGVAVVGLAVVLRSGPGAPVKPVDGPSTSVAVADADSTAPDEVASEMFLSIASALPWEDVEQVAMPRAETVNNLIDQLTPAEREALARLLRAGIGESRMTMGPRRAIVSAVAGVLLGVNLASAQDPPPPASAQPQTQTPPGRGARPGGRANLPPGPNTQQQLQEYFEIQTIVVAERELQLSPEQSPNFMTRVRGLQQVRRRHMQQRNRLLMEMRQLVQGPGPYKDDAILEKLKAFDEFNVRAAQELRQAEMELDGVLTPWQRVRFRMLEERLDRQKLDLLIKLREGNRGGGAAPQGPPRPPGLHTPAP